MMLGALLLAFAPAAHAGERFFAWSYGAATVPAGEVELEPIATVETHEEGGVTVAEWKHEVELEYGITPSLEAGVYATAEQTDGGPLTFSAYKARLRYRFWPIGTRPIELAAYLEYIGSPTFEDHGVEGKLILAHEGKKVRAALNVTGELEFEGEEMEFVLEPTAGVAWRFAPAFALGVEAKLETVFAEEMEGPFVWAGPTVHLAGKDSAVWVNLSAIVALTDATREDAAVEARSMIGIDL